MIKKMEIHLYMAPSLNGIIAHSDGSEEFISESAWELHEKLAEEAGAIIVGRRTLEAVDGWNDERYSLDKMNVRTKIVVTSSENFDRKDWDIVSSPAEAVAILQVKGHASAQLVGGSLLAGSFLNEKLVNKIHFLFQPWLVSEGVPIASKLKRDIRLKIVKSEALVSGEVLVVAEVVY